MGKAASAFPIAFLNNPARDVGEDGGDDGAVEAKVEELLGGVGDAEDVISQPWLDVEASNGADEEEAEHDGELASNHESSEVIAVALEEEVAGLLSEEGGAALAGGELGHGEEGDLHALEHAD